MTLIIILGTDPWVCQTNNKNDYNLLLRKLSNWNCSKEWETDQNDRKNKHRLPDPSLTLFLGLLTGIFLGAKGSVSIEENQDRHPRLSFEATPGKTQNPLHWEMPQRVGNSFAARRCRLASPPRPMPGISLTKNEGATHPKGTSRFSHSPEVAVWSPPSAQPPRGTQTSFRSAAAGVFPPRLRREAGKSGDGRGEGEPCAREAPAPPAKAGADPSRREGEGARGVTFSPR